MRHLSPAERLLQELGVTQPSEIDLEAIAEFRGVEVLYRPLKGCEGQIVGHGNRAVDVINAASNQRRQRFSLAHELGHWHHHRGKILSCRTTGEPRGEGARGKGQITDPERVADRYAADLLMPGYLFRRRADQLGRATIEAAERLADEFGTSLTATLIRLVEMGPEPALLVCHGDQGRKWFARGPDVPERWFPQDTIDASSSAMDALYKQPRKSRRCSIGADAWFNSRAAGRFHVHEQAVSVMDGQVLALVVLSDPEMLDKEEYGY